MRFHELVNVQTILGTPTRIAFKLGLWALAIVSTPTLGVASQCQGCDVVSYVSGNQQSAPPGSALAATLVVRVTDQNTGQPLSGLEMLFEVIQEPTGATGTSLNGNGEAVEVFTQSDGTASVQMTLGNLAGLYQVNAGCLDCGAGFTFSETATSCVNPNDINLFAGGPYSLNGRATSMIATFTPTDVNGLPIGLAAAKAACNVTRFNFQQMIDVWPGPSSLFPADPTAANWPPNLPFTAPLPNGSFPDPPNGGYTYNVTGTANRYPYYWPDDPNDQLLRGFVITICRVGNCADFAVETDSTMLFVDSPADPCLLGGNGAGCPGFAPPFSDLEFTANLVGIDSNNNVISLFPWSWISNFNGTSNGVVATSNYLPVDQGSGAGGVAITSINGTQQGPIVFQPSSINFGNVLVNRRKKKVLTLENNSTTPVKFGAVSFTNISGNPVDFTSRSYCGERKIGPGHACTIAILFRADAAAMDTATLNVVTSAPGSPLQVPVSATGIVKK